MTTAVPILTGVLSVACFASMGLVQDAGLRATLLILGVGFGFVAAGFAWITESQKLRRKAKLGEFLRRAMDLSRECDNEFLDFAVAKKKCDILEHEEDAYILRQFGSAEVALLNNSQGIVIHLSDRTMTPDRNNYANWCRYRAVRLTEMIGRL